MRPSVRARRFLSLLASFWRLNLAEEMQYATNFAASLVGTVFWMATALLTVAVFFRHTQRLGGWDFWEVAALLGIFNALAGVVEALLRPGLGRLAQDVRSGALDLVLVRPVEPQLYVSFRRLNVWRLADIVLGLGLSFYALSRLGVAAGVGQLLGFAVTFASAIAVIYAIWLSLMSLAFWFVAVENLSVLFDAVYEAARYPVSAYPGALRFLFVYLLPIAWTTTVPSSVLTGRLSPVAAAAAVGVAALALTLSRLLWSQALRRYTSAGG